MNALAAIHVAKKQLGLDDDTYRDLLVRVTGKPSAKAMNPIELRRVVTELRRQGFNPASTSGRKRLEGKFAPKLQALWIAGYNLGLVRDRRDDALVAFVRRQTGVDHVRFLHHSEDARRAIEGLKGWLARDGGVSWAPPAPLAPDWMKTDGYRIVSAQLRILAAAGQSVEYPSFPRWFAVNAARLPALPPGAANFQRADWQRLMNHLGELVRKLK